MMQIVENDNRIMLVKFEKNSPFIFDYLNDKVGLQAY